MRTLGSPKGWKWSKILKAAPGLGIVIAVLLLPCWEAKAAPNLYKCTILQSGQLSGGYVKETQWTQAIRQAAGQIIFDPSTKRLFHGTSAHPYEVVQSPSQKNGLIAVRIYEGLASVVVQTFRIETWAENMPFIFLDQNEVYSGTCNEH
jgi:hypothetical protein